MNPIIVAVLEAAEPIVISELTTVAGGIGDKNLKALAQAVIPSLDTYLKAVVSSL